MDSEEHKVVPLIKKILHFMHVEFLEVIYIYTYCKKEIGEGIKMEMLWRI